MSFFFLSRLVRTEWVPIGVLTRSKVYSGYSRWNHPLQAKRARGPSSQQWIASGHRLLLGYGWILFVELWMVLTGFLLSYNGHIGQKNDHDHCMTMRVRKWYLRETAKEGRRWNLSNWRRVAEACEWDYRSNILSCCRDEEKVCRQTTSSWMKLTRISGVAEGAFVW